MKNSGIPLKKSVILVIKFVNQFSVFLVKLSNELDKLDHKSENHVPTPENQSPTLSLNVFVPSIISVKKPLKALDTLSAINFGKLLVALSKSLIPLIIRLNQPELSVSVLLLSSPVSVPLSPTPVSPLVLFPTV